MTLIRVKVLPKMSNHRHGWMARVMSSDRSWLSFCISTRQSATTRDATVRTPIRRSASAHAAGGATSGTDIADPSLWVVGGVGRVGPEYVVEAVPVALQARDQLRRGSQRPDA